jgi:hypothetical protein
LGWEYAGAIGDFQNAEEERSEDFEWGHPEYDFDSDHVLGSTYTIVDVGQVNKDDELPGDLPLEFVVYAIEGANNKRLWIAEPHLNEALQQ